MTESFNPGFFTVDNWFPLRYLRLVRPGAAAVYLVLRLHADRAGRCFPSQERLADLTGLGLRTVQLAVKTLEKTGLVKVTRRTDRKHGSYLLYELTTPSSEQDGAGPAPGPARADTAPSNAQNLRHQRADSAPPRRILRHPEGADSAPPEPRGEPDPGKGEPPRAESARLQGPAKASGCHEATSHHPEDVALAALWESTQTRRINGRAADAAEQILPDMVELVRQGIPRALMRDLLLRKSRDRGEYWSTFRFRAKQLLVSGPRHLFRKESTSPAATSPAGDQARATVSDIAARLTVPVDGPRLQ